MDRLNESLAAMPGCVAMLLLGLFVFGLLGFLSFVESGGVAW